MSNLTTHKIQNGDDDQQNLKIFKQLQFSKPIKVSRSKYNNLTPIRGSYKNEINNSEKGADETLITFNDFDGENEISIVEKLNNDFQTENYLNVPIDTRKVSIPFLRKSSQYFEKNDVLSRKMSTVHKYDDISRRSSQIKNLNSNIFKYQSNRSRPSISTQNNNNINHKHTLSLHPANFKNDQDSYNRSRHASIHVPFEYNRKVSIAKTATISDIMPFETQNQDEIHNELKFTTNLSKTGQCAMLKSYEDELYLKLKSKYPGRHFPRISTPTFNLHSSSTRTNELSKTPSLQSIPSCSSLSSTILTRKTNTNTPMSFFDMNAPKNEELRNLYVSKQIEEAMEILDDIEKTKNETNEEFKNTLKIEKVDSISNNSIDLRRRQSKNDFYLDIDSLEIHKNRLKRSDNINNNLTDLRRRQSKIDDYLEIDSIELHKNRLKRSESISNNSSIDLRRRQSKIDDYLEIDSIELHKNRLKRGDEDIIIKKYLKWQQNWSRMLTEMF